MIRHLPVLAAIFLALSGCKPKAIQGTVVVVNQPGHSVKLAGARIDVVSKSDLRAMIDARRAQYRQAWESNQAALKLAENDLQQATAHSEQSRAQRLFEQDHGYIALKAERDRVQQQISAYEINQANYNSRPPVALAPTPAPPPSGNEAAAFFKDILTHSASAQSPAAPPPAVDLSKARAYAESLSSKMDATLPKHCRRCRSFSREFLQKLRPRPRQTPKGHLLLNVQRETTLRFSRRQTQLIKARTKCVSGSWILFRVRGEFD
jgi:multidrug efflux pump subunit AcrA (membrane-fusion protein)